MSAKYVGKKRKFLVHPKKKENLETLTSFKKNNRYTSNLLYAIKFIGEHYNTYNKARPECL